MTDFLDVDGLHLEVARHGSGEGPTLVFLHEGLGSVGLWRDFPRRLAEVAGLPAFVYSRSGYGKSSPPVLPRRKSGPTASPTARSRSSCPSRPAAHPMCSPA